MPIELKPNPLPSPLDYVPPNSTAHRVTRDESWDVLAMRPDLKFAGVSSSDLCYFNFRTRHPAEINWYLRHKVGCQHVTHDHKNYMFSSADQPGIVYLPKFGVALPVHELKKGPPRLNAWLGIVGKLGTMFAVVGIETVAGAVVSLDDPSKWMGIGATVNRVGLGWGATGGASFVYITGVASPSQLNGWQQLELDFNLSLGENWGKMAASSAKLKRLEPIIRAMAKLGARTPGAFKALLRAEPDSYIELVKAAKSVHDFGDLKAASEPNVFTWDIPLGSIPVSAEASVFYGLSNFNATWDGT